MTPLKLGHVHLKVRDLDRAIDFYTQILGLGVTERVHSLAFLSDGEAHHTVALQSLGESATAPGIHSIGLYHTAFEVPTEEAYKQFLATLSTAGVRSDSVDHGISWATYFRDPDGNGVEVYLDRRNEPSGRKLWVEVV